VLVLLVTLVVPFLHRTQDDIKDVIINEQLHMRRFGRSIMQHVRCWIVMVQVKNRFKWTTLSTEPVRENKSRRRQSRTSKEASILQDRA
jgi:hypothetical protein